MTVPVPLPDLRFETVADTVPGEPHLPDPRARSLWTAAGAAAGLLSGALAAAGLTVLGVWPVGAGLAVAAIAGGVSFARAAWRRRTWLVGSRALELQRGVVIHRATSIPFDRIQQIDVERGPMERVMGLSQLVVRTAAATTDATVVGLSPADADALRQRLLELAGIDDVV